MIKLLQSNWLTFLLGSALYLGVSGYLFSSARGFSKAVSAPTAEPEPSTTRASWDFFNPEMDRLMNELAQEKKAVATREEQLNELSTRLEAERAEINIVLKSVQRMQKDFDRNVVRVREEEGANLK